MLIRAADSDDQLQPPLALARGEGQQTDGPGTHRRLPGLRACAHRAENHECWERKAPPDARRFYAIVTEQDVNEKYIFYLFLNYLFVVFMFLKTPHLNRILCNDTSSSLRYVCTICKIKVTVYLFLNRHGIMLYNHSTH